MGKGLCWSGMRGYVGGVLGLGYVGCYAGVVGGIMFGVGEGLAIVGLGS